MSNISAKEYQSRLAPLLKLSAIEDLVQDLLIKEEHNLIELKREEFLKGQRPSGAYIGYYSSQSYKKSKLRQNPLARGRVDLIRSGAFIDSFFLLAPSTRKNTGSFFGAKDKKRNLLVDRYGKDIMSINPITLSKLEKDIILPRFIRTIKQRFRIG